MTKIIVADAEFDGLLDTVTKMHCSVFNELGTDKWMTVTDEKTLRKVLSKGYTYVYHNGIGYDFLCYDKLYGIDYGIAPDRFMDKECQIIDTLVWSRRLNPDRFGGHGLEAWTKRVTGKKPVIEDWEGLSLEEYVHRCTEDVKITGNVFEVLLEEAGIDEF